MRKKCLKCGAEFDSPKGYADKTLCDKCAAEAKTATVIRERVCIDCGALFLGYPRSLRCSSCNLIRKRELARINNRKQRQGKTRKIGSIDYCEICGAEYTVNGGLQRYCPNRNIIPI